VTEKRNASALRDALQKKREEPRQSPASIAGKRKKRRQVAEVVDYGEKEGAGAAVRLVHGKRPRPSREGKKKGKEPILDSGKKEGTATPRLRALPEKKRRAHGQREHQIPEKKKTRSTRGYWQKGGRRRAGGKGKTALERGQQVKKERERHSSSVTPRGKKNLTRKRKRERV